MRILGIDPGYAIVGFGILDYKGNNFTVVEFGAITTAPNQPFQKRLKIIYDDLSFVIKKYNPDCIAIEKLFFRITSYNVCYTKLLRLRRWTR